MLGCVAGSSSLLGLLVRRSMSLAMQALRRPSSLPTARAPHCSRDWSPHQRSHRVVLRVGLGSSGGPCRLARGLRRLCASLALGSCLGLALPESLTCVALTPSGGRRLCRCSQPLRPCPTSGRRKVGRGVGGEQGRGQGPPAADGDAPQDVRRPRGGRGVARGRPEIRSMGPSKYWPELAPHSVYLEEYW